MPLTITLSRIASPKKSGPVSVPSSKTMSIERTVAPGGTGGNAEAGDHASRVQPRPSVSETGGGETQPMKCVPKSVRR